MIRVALVGGLIVCALVATGAAKADADPASDALYQGTLFLPYSTNVSPELHARLVRAVARARAAGTEIRVALVAKPQDLGGIPALYGRPAAYARFLDTELQFVYRGRVLVVMPQGAGLAKAGRQLVSTEVARAKPRSAYGDALARTAVSLVDSIAGLADEPSPKAAAGGPALTLGQSTSALPVRTISRRRMPDWAVLSIAAIAACLILISDGGMLVGRLRRSR
jgi:hypothetical protein